MYLEGALVVQEKVRHIIHDHHGKIQRVSQADNILAWLKNAKPIQESLIKKLRDIMREAELGELTQDQQAFFELFREQLRNCDKEKRQRRYSTEFVIKCTCFYRSSPKLYRALLKDLGLFLLTEGTVKRITKGGLTYKGGIDPEIVTSFKAMAASLEEKDRVLHLGIDEVHTLHCLQLFGGDLSGMTDDDEVAHVLLSVHAYSVFGNFSEMVSMTPKVASRADDIKEELDAAIIMLTEAGFIVHSISFDGHATNTAYYNSLEIPDGEWSIQHPLVEDARIYVYFDSVHLWKNMYNALLSRQSITITRAPSLEVTNVSKCFEENLNICFKCSNLKRYVPVIFHIQLSPDITKSYGPLNYIRYNRTRISYHWFSKDRQISFVITENCYNQIRYNHT